jgi:hypothetical protein
MLSNDGPPLPAAVVSRGTLLKGCRHDRHSCGKKHLGVETLNNHYFVSVSRFGKPSRWQWENSKAAETVGCEALQGRIQIRICC